VVSESRKFRINEGWDFNVWVVEEENECGLEL
jgi:hypothetical protein